MRAQINRLGFAIAASAMFALVVPAGHASAHPLGNFTTNTATQVTVRPDSVETMYVVDLAEIPTLQARQRIGFAGRAVPDSVTARFAAQECDQIRRGLRVDIAGKPIAFDAVASVASFRGGQAGLTTTRIECTLRTPVHVGSNATVSVTDSNFADRIGWREISARGDRVTIGGAVASSSPTDLLRHYPSGAVSSPMNVRAQTFSVSSGGRALSPDANASLSKPTNKTTRGNDGLTQRFQALVAHRRLSVPYALGALALAALLGGIHALAPGHGKTLMAAYVMGRSGGRREILTIGSTVALTHTIGVVALGTVISASSTVAPDRTIRWFGVASGALVLLVGLQLLRSRLGWPSLVSVIRDRRTKHQARRAEAARAHHDHPHHDHPHHDGAHHDHPHHDHPHHDDVHHDHPHHDDAHHEHAPHEHAHGDRPIAPETMAARVHPLANDPRFVVTSHAHGGWSHTHVLPAVGSNVPTRQLIGMGLAGGLVPSPSALVVLLGAIALGRIGFGIGLVVAYGVGLAMTLMAAGLLIVRAEARVRRWVSGTTSGGLAVAVRAMPLVSAFALVGGGILLLSRSLAKL